VAIWRTKPLAFLVVARQVPLIPNRADRQARHAACRAVAAAAAAAEAAAVETAGDVCSAGDEAELLVFFAGTDA
jgi:hypothetical protein